MPPSLTEDAQCLIGRARAATLAGRAPITTPGHCARRRTLASTERIRRAQQTRPTARRLCVRLWQHPPYFHDGGAATLADVLAHYHGIGKVGLTADQRELVSI